MTDNKKSDEVSSIENEASAKTIVKRRKFLAGVTAGAAASGLASSGNWVKPVVDSVSLPAHAQTSGGMLIRSRVGADGDEFNRLNGMRFNDGTYPITADNDPVDFDYNNFETQWFAAFAPAQPEPVEVNLDLTVNLSGPGDMNVSGPLSQTQTANIGPGGDMRARFEELDVDLDGGTANTTVTVTGTINAAGFQSRRVTYVVSS